MRLWHIDLIPYLPKSQLLAQWRELNSIFKKEDKHILINYIYDYSKDYLLWYSYRVADEMKKRNFKLHLKNYLDYFHDSCYQPFKFTEHNNEYLTICYWNLREKYLRGQKDFTQDMWEKLDKFYKEETKNGEIK